ncbi:squalene/phytoene synthase family protein [Pseudonocardia sp.]|uniref:squalene/phytoene synthase family protein n=1 Tax=Pseudonocardia sp. TaxID=60912 RepID=UPI0031FCD623
MRDSRSAHGASPGPLPGEARLRQAEQAENFPVAMRVLPGRLRLRLRAIYDVVRTIDDLGDEADGDRAAGLHAFADDLAAVWIRNGPGPRAPVLRRLVPIARDGGLPREPFDRLIAANLQDQRVMRYRTWDELLGYCTLSAEPIGRLVLAAFEVAAPPGGVVERGADQVSTALQLLEHWQDVAEDRDRGRVYLPAEDLDSFGIPCSWDVAGAATGQPGVVEGDLRAASSSPALRRLIAHETARAMALLDEGAGVVGRLHGWARLAVAGYVAGGRAAADALRRADWDVLAGSPTTRRRDVVRHIVPELIRSAL